MATNPLYNTNDSPNNQTQPTKAVNRQSVFVPRTHNKFDMSYFNYTTQKFGEYTPFFVMESVPRDDVPFSSSHEVRSFPMVSPFLSSLKLNKDYFLVPNQAIQPNTWEYIYDHPTQGDDVPDDAQNTWDFWGNSNFVTYAFSRWGEKSADAQLWTMLIMENFLSAGSLLYRLGYKINLGFRLDNDSSAVYSFDTLFEDMFSQCSFRMRITSDNLNKDFLVNADGENSIDLYTGFSLLRRYGSNAEILEWLNKPAEISFIKVLYIPTNSGNGVDNTTIIRMDRVCAYQLACSQYYVNPQVDFIYNAQLFRDNFYTLLNNLVASISPGSRLPIDYFTRNGINVPYDFFSQRYYLTLSQFMVVAFSTIDYPTYLSQIYDCVHYLLGARESLRFGDYFTDSRTRPLAIGDNYTPVTADGVDVIDMSRKIIYQRFRNAVIKLGNNFGDYLRGIFGSEPSPDYHIPKYIIHQEFDVNGFEVANTSTDQGNLITNLKSGSDNFAFEINVDMPCVLIGISSFSVPRVYCQTKDRQFMHMSRYDMFNPMLQYVGDQPVYNQERTQMVDGDDVFGYQSRFNEYKQRFSVASGGFVEYLPAWSFIADPIFGTLADPTIINVQSPDYLRAHDYEFNRFFNGYKGISLAKGYHFIMVYNNKCNCHRPLEINPSTL